MIILHGGVKWNLIILHGGAEWKVIILHGGVKWMIIILCVGESYQSYNQCLITSPYVSTIICFRHGIAS